MDVYDMVKLTPSMIEQRPGAKFLSCQTVNIEILLRTNGLYVYLYISA